MEVGLRRRRPEGHHINTTYLTAHRSSTNLRWKKGGRGDQRGRLIDRTKGGMNTKLHSLADADCCPIGFFMTASQVSD